MVNLNGTSSLYSQYQAYNTKTAGHNRTHEAAKNDEVKKAAEPKTENAIANLSEGAQAMLDKLKEKYKDADIFVADFKDSDEAQEIMSRGAKEYSLLISPDELEKMAADEKYESDQLSVIDGAFAMAEKIKEQYGLDKALSEEGSSTVVTNIGITIDGDGNTKIFAQLEELNEKQKERIQAARDKKAEEAKKEAKEEAKETLEKLNHDGSMSKPKKTTLEAGSIEELLEKIGQVDWSSIKEDSVAEQASRFDFKA